MTELARIIDRKSTQVFDIEVTDLDPWFQVPGPLLKEADAALQRGATLILKPDLPAQEKRRVIGVSVEVQHFVYSQFEILAPRQIAESILRPSYPWLKAAGSEDYFPLRAGSIIVGGRRSGFYDSDGVILSADFVGGDPDKFEDWAFLVCKVDGRSPNWVTFDDVNFSIAGPEKALNLRDFASGLTSDDTRIVDYLLQVGEKEILDYLSVSEDLIARLNAPQFESAVQAIYRNLGFDVQQMGRWNEADGGVDLLAVSKTFDSGEARIAIQCKASRNKISARPIRELAGVMPRFQASKGVVATTSQFTDPARQEGDAWFLNIERADRSILYDKVTQIMGDWSVDSTLDDGPQVRMALSSGKP